MKSPQERLIHFMEYKFDDIIKYFRPTNLVLDYVQSPEAALKHMSYLHSTHDPENLDEGFYREFFACFLYISKGYFSDKKNEENYDIYRRSLGLLYDTMFEEINGYTGEERISQILASREFYLPKNSLN